MAENTSATGGYLRQVSGPTEGQSLLRLFHGLLAGLTGFTATLIRPLWQQTPPAIPEPSVNWLAFGIQTITPEPGGAYQVQSTFTETITTIDPETEEEIDEEVESDCSRLTRHEVIVLALQVYGPNCQHTANHIRDTLEIGQNRAALSLAGVGFVGADPVTHIPELVNERWYDRADIKLVFRRKTERIIRILPFAQAVGEINGAAFETEIPIT